MSLINKMLQDLESRQGVAGGAVQSKPVYQDLRSAVGASTRPARTTVWIVLAVVAVAGAGYSVWDRTMRTAAAPVPAKSNTTAAVAKKPIPPFAPVPEPKQIVAQAPAATSDPITPPSGTLPAVAAEPAPPAAMQQPVAPPAPPVQAVQLAPVEAKPVAPPANKGAKKIAKAKPQTMVAKAESAEDTLVDKRMRPFTQQEKAESLYRQAVNFVDQGRSEDAARQLAAALAADPAHVKARELLVGISLKHGRWRDAQQLLEDGIAKSPMYYPFVQLLARIHVERGAEDKALVLLEGAAPRAAQDPDYKTLLATLYQRAGRHADAVASYTQLVEQRPQDARSWLGLAISLEAEKKQEAAAQAYQRARLLGGLSPQLSAYAEQRIHALHNK